VLLSLSTGHTIGLAAAAVVFIAFSLIVAMVIPRKQPDFPGNRLPALLVAIAVLFIGMLAAVEIFGVEEKEKSENTPAETQSS
jgi:hypothetical protein